MHIPGIGNISFFKSGKNDQVQNTNKTDETQKTSGSGSRFGEAQNVEQVRQRVIEDTVDLSPAAKAALEKLNLEEEISEDEAKNLAGNIGSSLNTNQGINLGLSEEDAANL